MSNLSTDATERKNLPVCTGVLDYFPDALAEISRVSRIGQQQHGLTGPLHWDRSKSTDESDAAIRHFMERNKKDTDGSYHAAKAAWRMLAFLQKKIEEDRQNENTASPSGPPPASANQCYTPSLFANKDSSVRAYNEDGSFVVWRVVSWEPDSVGRKIQPGLFDGCQQNAPLRNSVAGYQSRDWEDRDRIY